MHKMKPLRGFLISSIVILVLGGLFFFEGYRDPGDLPGHDRANAILAISVVVSGILFIIATSRMWFKHLWHDRYK